MLDKKNLFASLIMGGDSSVVFIETNIDNNVRFIHTDPLMHRIPIREDCENMKQYAQFFKETRFQAWDMISGRIMPELGGNSSYLDIIGVNYYLHNQEYILQVEPDPFVSFKEPICETIPFDSKKRVTLSSLCQQIYHRYQKPLLISETGCFGNLRKIWWENILNQVNEMLNNGLPIVGVCAYPIIDRHDWVNGSLTNSGLWDLREGDIDLKRHAHEETIELIADFINNLNQKELANAVSTVKM